MYKVQILVDQIVNYIDNQVKNLATDEYEEFCSCMVEVFDNRLTIIEDEEEFDYDDEDEDDDDIDF